MATSFAFKPIVTDGLVLCLDAGNTKSYPGSGTNWSDLTVNGNNGTLTGISFDSPNGGSILFNGVNGFAQVSNASSLNSTSGTINVWFKYISISGQYGASIIGKHDVTQSLNGYNIVIGGGGSMFCQIKNASQTTQTSSSPAFATNTWRCVTLSYTSGVSHSFYIDGQLFSSGSCVSFSMTSQPLRMIDSVDTFWGIMNGNISQVMIYNRVLSAAEVLQNYNATKNRFI